MERESFEDGEVAALLNKHFVAVKVDREERPDVDHIYMTVCQTMTGSGGWPLTIIMTPDRRPFFAGTYFPKHSSLGRPGLVELLTAVADTWGRDREKVANLADELVRALGRGTPAASPDALREELLAAGYHQLAGAFDPVYGGFGPAPKFPAPHNLLFLLRYWRRTGTADALAMVAKTLDAMSRGGIYDHIGGGFARYSTDERWLVPHFEKMAYDNALLCLALLEAWQCVGDGAFARVADDILAYVLRDMTGPEGGFYSAEDADSEGVEGKFYVWTPAEIEAVLGPADAALFCECYDITAAGNFEHASIPNRIGRDWEAIAARRGMAPAAMTARLAADREKLFAARERRVHPFKDDKVLTAWNGLMIAACAKASRLLDRPEYLAAAEKAFRFVMRAMVRDDGRLLARYRGGEAAFPAYLEDYAYIIWGALELFAAGHDPGILAAASALAEKMLALFGDEEAGGFYYYGADGERLLARPKEIYDGATPSGNSAAAYVLLRLARLTGNEVFAAAAEKTLRSFSGEVARQPRAHTFYLCALDSLLTPPRHIVIAGRRTDPAVQAMLATAERRFAPDTLVLLADPAADNGLPVLAGKTAVDGRATAYICENFACRQPIHELGEFTRALDAYRQG